MSWRCCGVDCGETWWWSWWVSCWCCLYASERRGRRYSSGLTIPNLQSRIYTIALCEFHGGAWCLDLYIPRANYHQTQQNHNHTDTPYIYIYKYMQSKCVRNIQIHDAVCGRRRVEAESTYKLRTTYTTGFSGRIEFPQLAGRGAVCSIVRLKTQRMYGKFLQHICLLWVMSSNHLNLTAELVYIVGRDDWRLNKVGMR